MHNEPYAEFARVYDRMGADHHSAQMVEYTFTLMKKHHIKGRTALDLCCGTGTAIKLFCDQGYRMSGLDGSAQMLAVAARKLQQYDVVLFHKTLPRFRLLRNDDSRRPRIFDFVTCYYDSLNYLKDADELEEAFRSVAEHLTEGGWFIFDMNTATALKTVWGEETYAAAQEEVAWIWKNNYDTKTRTATLKTTFFEKSGRLWKRFDEIHVERAYPNSEVRKRLIAAGFELKGLYRCFTFRKPNRDTTRICAVAKKK